MLLLRLFCLYSGAIFIASVFLSFSTFANEIQSKLDQANALRTSQPVLVAQIISELEKKTAEMSGTQKDQFIFVKAYSAGFSGRLEQAIEIASGLRADADVEVKIKISLLLANLYEASKRYEPAYNHLYVALSDLPKTLDEELQANVYTVATQLHLSAGVFDKALEFAQSIATPNASPRSVCISKVLTLQAEVELSHKFDVEKINRIDTECRGANEPLMAIALYVYIAETQLTESPAKLLKSMDNILPELEKIGFQFTILKARYYRGLALLQLQRLSEAKQVLQQVFTQAEQLQDHDIANKAVLHLAELAEQAGPQSQAVLLYKQHIAALNQHLSEYKERSIAYHLAQANYMENQNKLQLLQQQNAVLQLEAELKKQELWWTVLAGAAFISLLLAVLGLLQRKQRQLFLLANTDGLTGCLNRRRFSELAQQWLSQHPQQSVALLLFDIDLFKNINDRYGHSGGDAVLKALVSRLQQLLPAQSWFARLGGEEFAIWLGGASLTEAALLAEQCRLALCNEPLLWQQQQISISASFGVVAGQAPAELETLLQSADQLLYQAKTAGRNCCVSQAFA